MTESTTPAMDRQSRDAAYWAQPVSIMKVGSIPTGALNLNVEGRQLVGPLQGFGQLWQKTFRVRLSRTEVTPAEVIGIWKEQFPTFWPKWDHFYKPVTGIAPGEVGIINMLLPGDIPVGFPISTGVLIIYADDESFTFMNPLGHMFAGWITFSAYEEDGCTIAQIKLLVRCNDPIYELGFRLGASRSENKILAVYPQIGGSTLRCERASANPGRLRRPEGPVVTVLEYLAKCDDPHGALSYADPSEVGIQPKVNARF